jgi:hypothetical protein
VRGAERSCPRAWFGAAALLAFACSVYEAPGESTDAIGGGAGTAGDGAVAGTGATASGTDSGAASGTMTTSAGTNTGGVGAIGNTSGTGGEPVIDPSSGGEGGAPTVSDECPDDPDKLAPGDCGCGIPDAEMPTHADCHTIEALLVHRYDFEGSGTTVKDRVGTADGVVARGAALSKLNGEGVVLLGGGEIGPYIDLPNGLISSLKNATIESWVTWGGGNSWQRIFDFGDSTDATPENNPANGKTYLFVTPKSGYGAAMLGYSLSGTSQELPVKASAAVQQALSQVVAVVDDDANKLVLYIDGAKAAEASWTGTLAGINDVNTWLGRSQYINDPELNAVFHEFRIYDAALTAAQVTSTFHGGTDPGFLAY